MCVYLNVKECLKVKKSLPVSCVNVHVFELRFVRACVCEREWVS